MGLLAMHASQHILVVDDEADQLETLCRGLLVVGHVCFPARTKTEALALLAGPAGERIDLVLVDLSAPGKPGARLSEHVCRLKPGLPMLVVTGLVRSPEVIALGAQGVPILRKPFTPDQLGRAIQTALTSSNKSQGEMT